jgi:ribosome-associated protein
MEEPASEERERLAQTAIDDPRQFAIVAARIASDNKIEDVSVLDLRGLSNLADYFVVGTGTSSRQMHAVLDDLAEYAATVGRAPFNVADATDASWVLADYVDIVIHLFDEEHRSYYDLDGLWGDAPRVSWEAANEDASEAAVGTSPAEPETA